MKGENLKFFTYNDYIDYNQNLQKRQNLNKLFREEPNEFELSDIKEKIKTIIERIIDDKKENIILINEFFNLNIKLDNYQCIKLKEQQKNVKLYKERYNEKYFLFNYQTNQDNQIIYKMLNLCIEIIENWKYRNKNKENSYPIIFPIIIYLGDEKWNIKNEKKLKFTEFTSNGIYLSYNIIDFNKISKENLIKKQSILSNIMAIKDKDKQEINQIIKSIMRNSNNIEKYYKIKKIYYYLNNT